MRKIQTDLIYALLIQALKTAVQAIAYDAIKVQLP